MRRSRTAAAVIAAAGSLAAPALASTPTVHPGWRTTLVAAYLDARAPVSIAVQPSFCEGGNHCGRAVPGNWRTNANGVARVTFTFPRYYVGPGCGGYPCSTHPGPRHAFQSGTTASVAICTAVRATNYTAKCDTVKVRFS